VNLHLATLFCSSEKKNSFRSFPNNSRWTYL
jgi:YHS domain-containing protein